MPNSFCRLLSNGYSFSVNPKTNRLTVGPCCLHDQKLFLDNDILAQRSQNFNSITGWTKECNQCHSLEQSGQQSLRQTGPDWIPDTVDDQSAVMIDINLDNECNAACVICGEWSSTLWQKIKSKEQSAPIINIRQSSDLPQQHIDKIIAHFNLDKVTYVKFFGGEPLFTNTHITFLEKIPYPQQVTVHYTTNGSIYPTKEVIDVWKKFKTVIFAASLDGVGKQFDYVRWPLPWSKVSANLLRLRNLGLPNVLFRIEFTANVLNTYYYDLLHRWVDENWANNLFGDLCEINIHPCRNNAFALEHMPLSLRSVIAEKYHAHHILHNMVKNLKPKYDLDEFHAFVNKWDHRRNIFWQDNFPDLVAHFSNK